MRRLCSQDLPEDKALRTHLITAYFERIHPLRCLSFIHKPSFMHALDRASLTQDYIEPLIYTMCALGAKSDSLFHCTSCFNKYPYAKINPRALYSDSLWSRTIDHIPGSAIPGEAWAERARREVLLEAHAPTAQHLMVRIHCLICRASTRSNHFDTRQ